MNHQIVKFHKINHWWWIVILFLSTGCQHYRYHDPTLKKSEQAYEQELTMAETEEIPVYKPSVKKEVVSEKFAKPIPIKIKGTLPIRDIAAYLSEMANVHIIVDPQVQGDVFVWGKAKSIRDIFHHICLTKNWIYRIQGELLMVMPDRYYSETYNLHFLNLKRQNDAALNIGTDVFHGGYEEKNRDSMYNGSVTKISTSATTDFWQELENNLKIMLVSEEPMQKGESNIEAPRYTLHKQAGLLTIYGRQKHHEQIQKYIQLLKENTSAQVLIEAKIIEVNLNHQFQAGIDWYALKKHFAASMSMGSLGRPGGINIKDFGARNVISLGSYGKNLSGLVHFLNTFGTVRTLSNPRLTVLNNHPALLKVATNHVYFKVNYNREFNADGKAGFERASSQVHTVPVGLILGVQPSINFETGQITLSLRPTISRIVGNEEDPAIGILTGNNKSSRVPVVQMRELDSVIQMQSGEVILLGGLMEERADNTHNRNPIPGFDKILQAKEDIRQITELVILLRAYILPEGYAGISTADRRLYNQYTKDPRKLAI